MATRERIDYYRKYNEAHRAEINERSRERYHHQKTLFTGRATCPDVAKDRRLSYAAALEEITDADLRNQLNDMLDGMIAIFMTDGKLGQYAAENQALEFIAALVWKKATAPRKTIAAIRIEM